jgi:hypothetical protein
MLLDVIHHQNQNQLYKCSLKAFLRTLAHAKLEYDSNNHNHNDLVVSGKHYYNIHSFRNQFHAIKDCASEIFISQIAQSR